MYRSLLIFFVCIVPIVSHSQTYTRTYFDNPLPKLWLNDLKPTVDSGLIGYGGYEFGNMNRLVKFDGGGNIEWSKSIESDTSNFLPDDVQLTSDGGYITSSIITFSNVSNGFFLHKFDSAGNLVMEKKYSLNILYGTIGGNENIHTCITSSNNLVVTFNTFDSLGIGYATICMLDSNLDITWLKIFQRTITEESSGGYILETTDGNLLFAGSTYGVHNNVMFIKIDMNGNIIWSRIIDFGLDAYVRNIVRSKSGDIIVSGIHTYNLFVARIDNNGVFSASEYFRR